jgi:Flp pilus assembly protein TadD
MAQVIELPAQKDTSYVKKANAAMAAGEIDAAYAIVDEVLLHDPDDAQALCIASDILKKAKKLPIAYQLAKRAAELRPDRPEAWSAQGHAAQQLWRMDEAMSCYRKAMQRASTPEQRTLYFNNMASVHLDTGQFRKAEAPCRDALKLSESDTNVRHNLGLSLLAQRKWEEGWKYYSASIGTERRNDVRYRPKGTEEPIWDGSPGKSIVIYGEQGLGDEICAASLLPEAIRDCRKVIVDCDHRLAPLFRRSFPQASVYGTRWAKPGKAPPGVEAKWKEKSVDIEASISAFEVAKFYRKTDADFPGTPYLTPCPDRTAMWKALFAGKQKPTIGVAWTGGIWQNAGLHRKLPLIEWAPIFKAVDAHWVSLQYKDAAKEIEGTPVVQYPWATLTQDYDDTAALVAACDLVICMQTSVVHLAGALGIPAWSLIPKTSQWRYGEEGETLPWYQSVRMFRQTDKWPVQRIADELRARFHKP